MYAVSPLVGKVGFFEDSDELAFCINASILAVILDWNGVATTPRNGKWYVYSIATVKCSIL